jgi:hypothetical protein
MKTITVTERQVREALGPVTAYSPLGNQLIFSLFRCSCPESPMEKRIRDLEHKVKALSKRKTK